VRSGSAIERRENRAIYRRESQISVVVELDCASYAYRRSGVLQRPIEPAVPQPVSRPPTRSTGAAPSPSCEPTEPSLTPQWCSNTARTSSPIYSYSGVEQIISGTREGLAAARERGRVGGRPTVITPEILRAARDLLPNPENSITTIAKLLGVSSGTLYNHIPDLKQLRAAGTPGRASVTGSG